MELRLTVIEFDVEGRSDFCYVVGKPPDVARKWVEEAFQRIFEVTDEDVDRAGIPGGVEVLEKLAADQTYIVRQRTALRILAGGENGTLHFDPAEMFFTQTYEDGRLNLELTPGDFLRFDRDVVLAFAPASVDGLVCEPSDARPSGTHVFKVRNS